jgi:hypothetical protein
MTTQEALYNVFDPAILTPCPVKSETAHNAFKKFPATSLTKYLTGKTALNIPSEEGTGDWHFIETFTHPENFSIAKESSVDTSYYFGNEGIFDCASVLVRRGLGKGVEAPVYAANHYRAICDLILDKVSKFGDCLKDVLSLDDWFPEDKEKRRVVAFMEKAHSPLMRENPAQWRAISQWVQTQI